MRRGEENGADAKDNDTGDLTQYFRGLRIAAAFRAHASHQKEDHDDDDGEDDPETHCMLPEVHDLAHSTPGRSPKSARIQAMVFAC